jgi:hypothetical protein
MRRPRHTYLVEKATHAAVAAIEIYNKPGFKYREETFSIFRDAFMVEFEKHYPAG